MIKHIATYIVAFVALAACNTTGCLDNQSAIPKAQFYSSADGKPVSLSNVEIRGVDAPHDSILVKSGEVVSEVYLPMRATKSTTSWRLHYDQDGLRDLDDLVTFDYESLPYFASEECGAMYNYRITRCATTYNLIDSVVVADSLITNVDRVRIRIYLRTTTPEETDE